MTAETISACVVLYFSFSASWRSFASVMQVSAPLPSIFVTDGTRLNTVSAMPANEPYTKYGISPSALRQLMIVHISITPARFVTTAPMPMGSADVKSSLTISLPPIDALLTAYSGFFTNIPITARKSHAPAVESVTPSIPAAAPAARTSVIYGKKRSMSHGFSVTSAHSFKPAKTLTAPSMTCETAVGYILLMPS